jgi:hypothetical protein
MTGPETLLLLAALLLAKHFVCDFVLQTPYQILNKARYGHPGGLLHAGIHGGATVLVLCFFPVSWSFVVVIATAETVLHYHIDWTKEQVVRRLASRAGSAFWAVFGFDQLLHQLTYIAIAALAHRLALAPTPAI